MFGLCVLKAEPLCILIISKRYLPENVAKVIHFFV